MNRKSRTFVGILTATVLTGAGVATMANAVATAQPAAPAVSVETATPTTMPTVLPTDEQRTAELARSVDDLLTQIGGLEQAVALGASTPTPTSSGTLRSGHDGSTSSPTAEPQPQPEYTTAPPQVRTEPTEDHSEDHSDSHESKEPSDD